jgi:signal transduction histidine kinase
LNKGYRFFITQGDRIVYQDNDLIARDLKSLVSVEDIREKTPEKQIMTQVSRDPAAFGYKTYVTIAGYYYADYNLGFVMVLCASAGFVLCMFGIILLERLAGRKISKGRKRIQYFNKGFIETILAVFLVSSFNITAIIQYVWAEYQLTDFFESGKAMHVAYAGAGLYIIVALWTITKVGAGLNIAEQNADILKKMKTDLIANVAHDIATPLTSIIGYVELLEQEESLSKEAKDYVDVLKSKSQRLKNILSDLFDLSKISTENNLTTENWIWLN